MEQFITMAEVQATLFIYMLVGYYAEKKGIINPAVRKGMTDLLVAILLPCMIVNSFNLDFSMELLEKGGKMLIMAFILSFSAYFAGKICWSRYPPERRKILQYGTLVANSGFAGLAVIEGAYGIDGLFLASIFIIPNRIFMWTAGISIFQEDNKQKNMLKSILLNPGIVAVFIGMGRMMLGVSFPPFIDSAISALGGCTSPISLVIIGGILSHVDWRSVFNRDTILSSVVRLILLPLYALALMKLCGFSTLDTAIAVILTGMPIGTTTAILAEKYGADAKFGSQCVFVSTLLSLVTVPLLTLIIT